MTKIILFVIGQRILNALLSLCWELAGKEMLGPLITGIEEMSQRGFYTTIFNGDNCPASSIFSVGSEDPSSLLKY